MFGSQTVDILQWPAQGKFDPARPIADPYRQEKVWHPSSQIEFSLGQRTFPFPPPGHVSLRVPLEDGMKTKNLTRHMTCAAFQPILLMAKN